MKVGLSIFFFSFFCLGLEIFSKDLSKKQTDLFEFLRNNSTHFLYPLESFNGETPYILTKSDSYLQDLYRIQKTPENEEYQDEKEKLKNFFKELPEFSMEIYSHIEIPEREKIRIIPKVPKKLPFGIPVRLFLWVYSENYLGKISLVLNHPTLGRKKLELGDLNFFGWSRLEREIPIGKVPRLNILRKDFFELEEIVLEFSKKQKKGAVHLFLHSLSVLMEKPSPSYPGIEIEDGWKIK